MLNLEMKNQVQYINHQGGFRTSISAQTLFSGLLPPTLPCRAPWCLEITFSSGNEAGFDNTRI